jgi:hypothetical protein
MFFDGCQLSCVLVVPTGNRCHHALKVDESRMVASKGLASYGVQLFSKNKTLLIPCLRLLVGIAIGWFPLAWGTYFFLKVVRSCVLIVSIGGIRSCVLIVSIGGIYTEADDVITLLRWMSTLWWLQRVWPLMVCNYSTETKHYQHHACAYWWA